jgi:hypothetical protein
MRSWPRHRFAWVPVLLVVGVVFLGLSFAAISTPLMWVILVVFSVLGWFCARRPRLGWVTLLPLLLCAEPSLSHSPLGDRVWTPGRLVARCGRNDGTRPIGFSADLAGPRYYSVTRLDEKLALVVGDRHSFWLARKSEGAFALETPSRARGNLWQGAAFARTIYFTKNHHFFRVERLDDGSERMTDFEAPDPPGKVEYDLAEPSYDPTGDRLFATELTGGGIRELSLRDGSRKRHLVGGFNLQLMRRSDGKLVGIDTARLIVFDPDADRIVEQHAAGIGTLGVDVCPVDGAVAITDMAGRVRIFERGPSGEYAFRGGISLRAPRRIAFSPDCSLLAVTSADDRTVWSIARVGLTIQRRFQVGPGLRDVSFVAPREIAVADACSATFLDAR